MNRCTMVIIFLAMLGIANLDAAITYRMAITDDIPALIMLYKNIQQHDRHALVILPSPFLEQSLQSSVEKQRLCIAYDNDAIIAVLKLYPVMDQGERIAILADEIRCTKPDAKLCNQSVYRIDNTTRTCLQPAITSTPCIINGAEIMMYYGGAYTLPAYRGQRINYHLQQYAYNHAIKLLAGYQSHAYMLVYGQDMANQTSKSNTAIITAFAQFCSTLSAKQCTHVQRYEFLAYKPVFEIIEGNLTMLPDMPEQEGRGNVLKGYCS